MRAGTADLRGITGAVILMVAASFPHVCTNNAGNDNQVKKVVLNADALLFGLLNQRFEVAELQGFPNWRLRRKN